MFELTAFPDAMPLSGLIGGLMIGLASAIMLLGGGRIAGISGLFAQSVGLSKNGSKRQTAMVFIISLFAGALLVQFLSGDVVTRYPPSWLLLVLGGLLVGFGTRLGSGCTSGHGVCGMSRFSRRSLVATPVFMGAGIATVAIMNMLGFSS